MPGPAWVWVLLALLAGLALGYRLRRPEPVTTRKPKPRLPQVWPLDTRHVVLGSEVKVWHWLQQALPELAVMVKVPVTRYTRPASDAVSRELFDLLNGVYTTFALCDEEGNIVACLDLTGPRLTTESRQLKQTLLDQCHITYWILNPAAMPSVAELRRQLIGEEMVVPEDATDSEQDRIESARHHLHETLDRQRMRRGPPTIIDVGDDEAMEPSAWMTLDDVPAMNSGRSHAAPTLRAGMLSASRSA